MRIKLKRIDHYSTSVIYCFTLDVKSTSCVSELKNTISEKMELSPSSFQLFTYKSGVKVMMCGSFPINFFIFKDNSVVLLEFHSQCLLDFESNPQNSLKLAYSEALESIRAHTDLEKFTYSEQVLLAEDECGWGLIHHSAKAGHSLVLEYLCELVSCNKETLDYWTPLQLAAYFGHLNCVKVLLQNSSIQINKMTKIRGSAIHLACEMEHEDVVQVLLEKRACCTFEDPNGKIPLELTKNQRILEIIPFYLGEWQLEKYLSIKPQSYGAELFMTGSFFIHDKKVFLYLDMEKGFLELYTEYSGERRNPSGLTKVINIQGVKPNTSLLHCFKSYYYFDVYLQKSTAKYYCKTKTERDHWVKLLNEAITYCQVNKIGDYSSNDNEYELQEDTDEVIVEANPRGSIAQSTLWLTKVTLSSFKVIEEIGGGSFGTVYKVIQVDTGKIYAMKVLHKKYLKRKKQLKYAIAECKIMQELKHPFIIKLHYAFATTEDIYLVLEYCDSGDLEQILEEKVQIPEFQVRFYVAEIVLALEYLHSLDILYRDLKPANVLIDGKGHARLADFGLAKQLDQECVGTLVGSPAYFSPEIVTRKISGKPADYYSLGITMYQLLTGSLPFYNTDLSEMFSKISTGKLEMPDVVSREASDLIKKLTTRKPHKRLNIEQIKQHEFFKMLDWDSLYRKKYKAPLMGTNTYSFEERKQSLDSRLGFLI